MYYLYTINKYYNIYSFSTYKYRHGNRYKYSFHCYCVGVYCFLLN